MTPIKQLKNFLSNRAGNVAMMFGIAVLPVMLAAGIALDYTSGQRAQTAIQYALDGAALAAGSARGLTDQEKIDLASEHFAAAMAARNIVATASFTINNGSIDGTVDHDYETVFGQIAGIDTFKLDAVTKVMFEADLNAEIALVLDYSSSMNSKGKWQAMRAAALDLVNTLGDNGMNTDVKFALAPFTKVVRANLPEEYVVESAKAGGKKGEVIAGIWTGCTQDRKWPHNISDSTPDPDEEDTLWGISKPGGGHCKKMKKNGLTVLPLTNNHTTINAQLSAMTPVNGTHISLGMEFGWHLVSPNPPYTEGVGWSDHEVKKFIVLLTDGRQTTKAWGPSDTYKKKNGEKNLEDMCETVKSKGVTVVTIAFDLKQNATKKRLSECATSAEHYFNADDNGELAQAF